MVVQNSAFYPSAYRHISAFYSVKIKYQCHAKAWVIFPNYVDGKHRRNILIKSMVVQNSAFYPPTYRHISAFYLLRSNTNVGKCQMVQCNLAVFADFGLKS